MNKFPFGVGIMGFLHGFTALYAVFTIGSLFIFAMSLIFMPEGNLKTIVTTVSFSTFLALCIIGIVLKVKKPDIFLVKEERSFTLRIEGSKIPRGEIVTEITELDKPKEYPQINNKPKGAGEQ